MNYRYLLIPCLIISLSVSSLSDRQIALAQEKTPMINPVNHTLGDTTVVMTTEAPLNGTRWQLVEMMGQKVSREDIYLVFNEKEKTVSGFNGCNLFSGSYELKEVNRLSFGDMIATMRACPEIEEDQEFMQLLKQTDNYALGDNVLSLHKAKMAPLLKFTATEAQ